MDGTADITQPFAEQFTDATAAVSASATFILAVSAATSFSSLLKSFEACANSLVYKGSATRVFHAMGILGLSASGAAVGTRVTFGVNSSALSRLEVKKNVGTADDEIVVQGMVQLANNDRISLMIRSTAADADGFAIKKAVLTVRQ